MTRHARNCTAGAVYTYHERKKDASTSGYGTESQRIGKDSVRNFDCCCLSLQPCLNPVVTKEGYLYDKEVIINYIIKKKNEISQKEKEYKKQLKKDEDDRKALAAASQEETIKKFIKTEQCSTIDIGRACSNANSVSNMANGKEKDLPSFWVPSKTPQAAPPKMKKPEKTVYCPMSGKPLKLSDLIDVKFTEVPDDGNSKSSVIAKTERYMCAVSHDILSNSIPAAVIKTTGDVVTAECIEKVIKIDWLHPLTGEKLTENDIIYLQRGGTGYATTNSNLEVKNERPVLQ